MNKWSSKDIEKLIKRLKNFYKHREKKPFKVLISTILSQRTKDDITEKVSEKLFMIYDTPKKLASANVIDIMSIIKPVGFYKIKSKKIIEVAKIIVNDYNSVIPNSIDELMKLPLVGRKTANCVIVYGFGGDAIPVDTHVHRVSNRLGLVNTKSVTETEKNLEKILHRKYWKYINSIFVSFGQKICSSKPKCDICQIRDLCPTYTEHPL